MMKLLLPLILLLLGVGGGVAAGLVLKPAPTETAEEGEDAPGEDKATAEKPPAADESTGDKEYAKLNNQFIVPVIENGAVAAMVVMSLSVEVEAGARTTVFAVEPKLRDGFLQVMFDHANIGGFSGNFTSGTNMRALRSELQRVARTIAGPQVTDVLIVDILRQDS
ncbi:flagellar basal body-associated FliL family protein [Yoonia sp. SS1-5]|uniref:Flagellar basal body-associated FliL family protein n=1 Tax=Yoonia rhodophyticola TaxID=3137370 RepID=A0AAN0NJB1_9RHOB